MALYICKLCNFSTNLKSNYKRHLNTNKHLKNEGIIDDKNEKRQKKTQKDPKKTQKDPKRPFLKKKNKCDYCEKCFSSFAHKRRHELHVCKFSPYVIEKRKKTEIDELKKNVEMLKVKNEIVDNEKNKQIEKLEEKVDKLVLNSNIINTCNINKSVNVNNVNNIKINSYGNEDLSYISDNFKTELLKVPYGAIPEMIKAIHFNENKPENQNIIYPNVNKQILKVKSEEGWKHKNMNIILYDMIDSKYLMLDEHYNLIVDGEKLSNFNKNNYIKFRDKYDNGNKDLFNELKDECKLIMLDKRNK